MTSTFWYFNYLYKCYSIHWLRKHVCRYDVNCTHRYQTKLESTTKWYWIYLLLDTRRAQTLIFCLHCPNDLTMENTMYRSYRAMKFRSLIISLSMVIFYNTIQHKVNLIWHLKAGLTFECYCTTESGTLLTRDEQTRCHWGHFEPLNGFSRVR